MVVAADLDSHREPAVSAIGPKQTSVSALQMSAFGGKAVMGWCSANVC